MTAPGSVMATRGFTVRTAQSNADLQRFIDFQYDHYRGDTYWVPPIRLDVKHTLDPQKNPFFDHGEVQPFLLEDAGGRTVGRIAAIVNGMHLKKYEDDVGFFGFFEVIEQYEAAKTLIEAAAEWLRGRGMKAMRGPTNPSLNDVAGLLVKGFDRRPALMMPYNKPYYEEYLVRSGFERAMTMWAYFVHEKYASFDKLWRGRDLVLRRQPDLRVRTIDMSRFDEEARTILDIYNDAWSQNWGHVPMTEREFARIAKDMKQIVDPSLIVFVENSEGPIGFAISLPDMNYALRQLNDGRLFPTGILRLLAYTKLASIPSIRMLLMGVRQEFQGRGIDSLLVASSIENGQNEGYESAELSWVLDGNRRLINHLEAIGSVKDKEYGLYERPI